MKDIIGIRILKKVNQEKKPSKVEIEQIIMETTKEVLSDCSNLSLDLAFTGPDSSIKSLDIVQIISGIEEKLEERGVEGYDLFETIFEVEKHSFSSLAVTINEYING